MNPFVRTNHTTLSLLLFSKIAVVLLLIFFPVLVFANPVYQSSSNRYAAPSTVDAQSVQYQPTSYQMTNTSNYQMSTTLNPAQTVYTPFSDENPSNSGSSNNGQSRISNRRNLGENTSGNPNAEETQYPLGDAWSLLFFAALSAGVIFMKQRKKIQLKD